MKKNISINISGIIFHIEEDGYDVLKKYLDSISKYFASFEDSAEIMADIESRIAEIFLSKLSEGKQVITLDDVNALVATMGSVRDFKAAEADGDSEETASQESSEDAGDNKSFKEETKYTYHPPKQLVRDQKRKILGGVCAGLGHYLNVDPVWVRLLFALITATYGVGLLVYVVMWIAMPGSYDLEEPATAKKMFRDPENKVLAGVSGGIAAYFGIDIIVVRILFVVFTITVGIGLLVYIVLWIILPEARTITDRMQMQGEPVTLSNIESNIKKNLDVKEGEEESVLVKILLLPFRVIAFLIEGLAKILGPLTEVLRVIIGAFITVIGFGLVFSVIVAIGLILGILTFPWPWLLDQSDIAFPLETIRNLIPGWMALAGCIAAIIPCILVILLGLSIMSKRTLISAPFGWAMFVLFFVSLGALSFGIPQIAYSFKEVGEYKVEKVFPIDSKKTLVFRINEVGMDDYDAVALTLRGYEGKDLKLAMGFEAHGSTKQNAIENAQMVEYNVEQQDSILIFDSNIRFKNDAIFRAQRLKQVLYIPYDHPFSLDETSSNFISQYIDWEYKDGYTWKMTQKGLECINCPQKEDAPTDELNTTGDLRDFDEIELSGVFDASIQRGDGFAVEFTGPQSEKEKYHVYRSGETLVIDFEGKKKFDFNLKEIDVEEVRINVTMPRLERLEASGYGSIRFDRLDNTEDFEIEANGPVKIKGELFTDNLIVNLNGSSQADLSGKANALNADVKFASALKAYNLEVNEAIVEVNGASSAKVNVSGTLEMEEGVASDIDYRGNPQVIKRD